MGILGFADVDYVSSKSIDNQQESDIDLAHISLHNLIIASLQRIKTC